MRSFALLLFVLLFALPAPAAAGAEEDYQQARLDYFALRKDETRRQFRHHWQGVLRRLDSAAGKLKGDARCGALFNAGRAWHDVSAISYLQDDRSEAIQRYERLVGSCPKSSLADDALFHAAELQSRRDAAAARRSGRRGAGAPGRAAPCAGEEGRAGEGRRGEGPRDRGEHEARRAEGERWRGE